MRDGLKKARQEEHDKKRVIREREQEKLEKMGKTAMRDFKQFNIENPAGHVESRIEWQENSLKYREEAMDKRN